MAAPGSARRPLLLLLLLLLLGLVHCASAAMFMVKNGNGTACIMANFSASFSVNYDTKSGPKNMTFDLPSDATVVLNRSSCGKENTSDPSLVIAFGRGHTLTLNFTRNATRYSVQLMSFVYNLSDTHLFPNASSKETRCEQDRPSPTTAPPAPPSPSPSPVPESPSVDKYNVSGTNGTCLLASMGLQLNLTYERKDNTTVTRLLNINPNKTSASGSCGAHLVTLELHSEGSTVLLFLFGMNASSSRFFLQGIQLNTILPDARDPAFKAANGSLRALQATVGNSYKCNAEEHVRVTKAFSVNIFKVWVQAFKVEGGQFGSVEECLLDENNMLIPIAVGGALAGLVLIVLIAYLVGRKRSHAGYQTI
ncbi:lysosome-associated membrane glycoprotein 1 isoform X2 [Pan paniscus]|uniref:lysosome-associated membrane glycoprotein 1 isoform X2 n=1 Tax=Pan paniscus TaxID=9597 RepID=UPI00156123F3|nr:lysosome-associated membrane glycoprotein 1 isoform X2 [Pan paniscus]